MSNYIRPTDTATISSSWSAHRNRPTPSTEPGTDYAAAYGSKVYAVGNGIVVDTKTTNTTATGRYVTIDLSDGRRTRSLHLSRVKVRNGQRVKRGQVIGLSGGSGFGSDWGYGPHVHQTLWATQAYRFGKNATLDFQEYVSSAKPSGGSIMATAKQIANAVWQFKIHRPIDGKMHDISVIQEIADIKTQLMPVKRGGKMVVWRQDVADTGTIARRAEANTLEILKRLEAIEKKLK